MRMNAARREPNDAADERLVRRRHLGRRVPAPACATSSTRPACSRSASTGPANCSSRPSRGWKTVAAPEMTQERCLSLATAVATYCDQQINQERPLLSATLPSGERIQFVIPPAVTRGTVSITVRKPSDLIKRLDDFEREGLFERTATVSTHRRRASRCRSSASWSTLKEAGRYAEFLRLAVRKHQTIVVSGKTGSGKTTFMKGLVEEVPQHERLDHDPGHRRADAAEPPERRAPLLQQGRAGHGEGHRQVAARSVPAHEAGPHLPGRGAWRRMLPLRAARRLRPPGQHHQRARRQLRAGLRADGADDPRERRRRRAAHARDQVAARVVVDVVVQFDRDERGRFVSELFYEPRRQRLARWDDAEGGAP